MASKLYCEFNEATQLKTSLVKNSIKFNDIAVQMRPYRIAYLRLLGRPYTLLYVHIKVFFYNISFYCTVVQRFLFPGFFSFPWVFKIFR